MPTKKTNSVKKVDNKKLANEYLAGWKRERSDFENYKKNEMERAAMLMETVNHKMLLNMLEIVDNFELALKHTPQNIEQDNWFHGIQYIKQSIDKFLEQENVSIVKTTGEKFDPALHEALDGQGENIKEEIRKGYMYNGKLLRPARVKLS